jgi:hypothetical protein
MKSVKNIILFRSKDTLLWPYELGIKADYLIGRKFWNTELNQICNNISNYFWKWYI